MYSKTSLSWTPRATRLPQNGGLGSARAGEGGAKTAGAPPLLFSRSPPPFRCPHPHPLIIVRHFFAAGCVLDLSIMRRSLTLISPMNPIPAVKAAQVFLDKTPRQRRAAQDDGRFDAAPVHFFQVFFHHRGRFDQK